MSMFLHPAGSELSSTNPQLNPTLIYCMSHLNYLIKYKRTKWAGLKMAVDVDFPEVIDSSPKLAWKKTIYRT